MRVDVQELADLICSRIGNIEFEVDLGQFGYHFIDIKDSDIDMVDEITNILRDELDAPLYTDIVYVYKEDMER